MTATEVTPTARAFRPFASRVPDAAWLLAGVIVTALAGNRFNVAVLGWIAAVPWLVYLRRTDGLKSRALFLLAIQLGTLLQVAKIVTEPIPWLLAPMFSVPMALFGGVAFVGFEAWRRRVGDAWGLVLFPAITVVVEWASFSLSEMGSWGSIAYTQLDNLPLLQVTALFGLTGITVLLAATSAVVAVVLDSERPARWRAAIALIGTLVVAAYGWGAARLSTPQPGPLVTVATVATDIGLGADGAFPDPAEIERANNALFARTKEALDAGAQLVVWNEGSTAIDSEDEPAFLARGQAMASANGADLVLAYVVPRDDGKMENKYVWMTPDGAAETYLKHHPVPGEPSIRGTDPIEVLQRPYGRAAGAICYDYDFPSLGLEHARGGAGVVAVPSSDWLGIDPYHTQMARVRGIEGGFSVVRSVRWATSGAYDALGRARGTANWFEGARVMVAQVPAMQIPTLYARVGDVLGWLALVVLLASIVPAVRARRR
jgi:apolipoprotein N-acyltransferase